MTFPKDINFHSDNVAGVADDIMDAIVEANSGNATSYGADEITARAMHSMSKLFEQEVSCHFVTTGMAANVLCLAALVEASEAIFCHEQAHILFAEAGAPQFFTGGATLITVSGANGKIDPKALTAGIEKCLSDPIHFPKPGVLSVTQVTEAGTTYTLDELAALTEIAKRFGLRVHMDGARFENAVAALGCSPAALTWRLGVDALSFGATKNGAMAAEVAVLFDQELARDFTFRQKRGGHVLSKQRFVAAQIEAYLKDENWLGYAAHSNATAQQIAERISGADGVALLFPVDGNQIFLRLSDAKKRALEASGIIVSLWPDERGGGVRLVTAFNTPQEHVDALVEVLA